MLLSKLIFFNICQCQKYTFFFPLRKKETFKMLYNGRLEFKVGNKNNVYRKNILEKSSKSISTTSTLVLHIPSVFLS